MGQRVVVKNSLCLGRSWSRFGALGSQKQFEYGRTLDFGADLADFDCFWTEFVQIWVEIR